MSEFDIRWTEEYVDGSEIGNAGRLGVITFGDESETFQSLIGFWSPLDYQRQWSAAIRRVVEERKPSCLVTSVSDPLHSDVIHCWLLYPDQYEVTIRNALLLRSNLAEPFDTTNPHKAVAPYSKYNEDGLEISEWRVPISELHEFLAG